MRFASTICFMCLSEYSSSNIIELHKIDEELIKKITFVIPEIPVCKSKSPHYVCTICRDKLKYFNNFKKMCKMNYYRWIFYINKFEKKETESFSDLNVVLHTPNIRQKSSQDKEEVSSTDDEDFMEIEKEIVDLNKKLTRTRNKPLISSPDPPKPSTSGVQNGVYKQKPSKETEADTTTVEIKTEKRYACHLCTKDFSTNSLLLDHISYKHKGIRRHSCKQCNQYFTTASQLVGHCKRVHGGDKVFRCQFCPTVFISRDDMMEHLYIEHKEGRKVKTDPDFMENGRKKINRTVQCDLCKRRFMNKAAFISHRKTHFSVSKDQIKLTLESP